jgi:hypothetical protein
MTNGGNDFHSTRLLYNEVKGPTSATRRRIGAYHRDDTLFLFRIEKRRLPRARLIEKGVVEAAFHISAGNITNGVRGYIEIFGYRRRGISSRELPQDMRPRQHARIDVPFSHDAGDGCFLFFRQEDVEIC